MKRLAVTLGVITAMGVVPSVAQSAVSAQVKPAIMKPALVKPGLVRPALLKPALVRPALVRPAVAWRLQLRLSVLRNLAA